MRKEPREIEGVKRVIHPSVSAPPRVHHGKDGARSRVDIDSRGFLALRHEAARTQREVLGEAVKVVEGIVGWGRIAPHRSYRGEEHDIGDRLDRSCVRQPQDVRACGPAVLHGEKRLTPKRAEADGLRYSHPLYGL